MRTYLGAARAYVRRREEEEEEEKGRKRTRRRDEEVTREGLSVGMFAAGPGSRPGLRGGRGGGRGGGRAGRSEVLLGVAHGGCRMVCMSLVRKGSPLACVMKEVQPNKHRKKLARCPTTCSTQGDSTQQRWFASCASLNKLI
jgi:hypothetical protein